MRVREVFTPPRHLTTLGARLHYYVVWVTYPVFYALFLILSALVFLGLVFPLQILAFTWSRYFPPKPKQITPAALAWAESRFPPELRVAAAYLADVLCGQAALKLTPLEPHLSFYGKELDLNDLEDVEVLMALEEELGLVMPEADAAKMNTIYDLTAYLAEHCGEKLAAFAVKPPPAPAA